MAQFYVEAQVVVKAPNSWADHHARAKVFQRLCDGLPDKVMVHPASALWVTDHWEVTVQLSANVTAASYSVVENRVDNALSNLLSSDRVSWTLTKIEKVA